MIENLTNIVLPENLIQQLKYLVILFQAIGGLVILYILFGIINLIINRKKNKELIKIRQLLEIINKKLEKIKK